MKRLVASGSTAALAIGVLALVAAGGYALAASSGTIHACAVKSNGALRAARHCKRSERALSWNAVGPAGPRGAQGPQGLPGPQGLSSALSGSIAGPVTITAAITPGDKVGHLNLPPGRYVILAKAWIENKSTTNSTTAGCDLDAGGDSDFDFLMVEPSGTNAFRGALTLNVTHTFTSAGTAQLSCFTGAGVTVTANNAVVTAIQVGALYQNALLPG
jgi:hypothetical protein